MEINTAIMLSDINSLIRKQKSSARGMQMISATFSQLESQMSEDPFESHFCGGMKKGKFFNYFAICGWRVQLITTPLPSCTQKQWRSKMVVKTLN